MDSRDPSSDSSTSIECLLEEIALATPQSAEPNLHLAFTLFPKLATELRLKILEHALPIGNKGRRFIEVKARISAPSRRSKEPCWFILEDNAYSTDVKDVGLLGANKESRDVYLRCFDKLLRAKGDGLIRYHEDDIIFVCTYPRKLC